MAKDKSIFVCQQCGYESSKWYGKCPSCNEWNSLVEEIRKAEVSNGKQTLVKKHYTMPVNINNLNIEDEIRYKTGISEFDRVLGGGIVKGSLVLIGGDPGIGKSTILLQMCKHCTDKKIFYVSGEESEKQIKLRAQRLDVTSENLFILNESDIEVICSLASAESPDILIIDSIQTMYLEELSSSPGSVAQVRESTSALMRLAKKEGIPVFIVGHVNKEGSIAGPKVMEHMVDTVLYFEGEKQLSFRILRSVKNRFGSTNEIGVFEMSSKGLLEVLNPSLIFLSGKPKNVSGTAVACVLEGTRPLFAEIQSLVCQTPFSAPRRMAVGVEYNRMCLLIAVLEKRAGLIFSSFDVYLNVIGGLKINDPSSDLAILLSLASGIKDKAISEETFIVGEVGLAGEVRAVLGLEYRIKEAIRLGFKKCIIPHQNKLTTTFDDIELVRVKSIYEAINYIN
ncbi:MAG: DNA repair protein RadA [Clostridia bacterium]